MELSGQLHALDYLPLEKRPVHNGQEAGWAHEVAKRKIPAPAGNRIQAAQPVANYDTDGAIPVPMTDEGER
jgi:hypothetical protein